MIEAIKAEGTNNPDFTQIGKPSGQIRCVDGFRMSVQAGIGMYCTPRPDGFNKGGPGRDYQGPYTAAEVGFPSERPEPWSAGFWLWKRTGWREFAENSGAPTDTVYGHVPFALIEALIELHGGEVTS